MTEWEDAGRQEWVEVIEEIERAGLTPEGVASDIGIRGLSWMIEAVLGWHYPADLFGKPDDLQYGVTWRADLDHGPGLDPGVKWACLLRMALDEVRPKEEK